MTRIHLDRRSFGDTERLAVEHEGLTASLFRYPTGVEAVRLANARGALVVLPYLGQMIWSAAFDGVDLTMRSMFKAPRPVRTIAETYGCFAFHSGLLRNGVPGPTDTHPAHGEMPCAPMDSAGIELGTDARGPWMRLFGAYEYAMGFGAHYMARPSVTLHATDARFDMAMEVTNLSAGDAMDLMYMAHVNYAFVEGGEILQQAPYDATHTAVRRAVPAHVAPNPTYLARIEALATDPSGSRVVRQADGFDPEQVFYLTGLAADAQGATTMLLRRPEGDAFLARYRPAEFPKTVRWILAGHDQSVCAFALPATCEPEGYTAEKAKGNVIRLPAGATARYSVELGHLDAAECAALAPGFRG